VFSLFYHYPANQYSLDKGKAAQPAGCAAPNKGIAAADAA